MMAGHGSSLYCQMSNQRLEEELFTFQGELIFNALTNKFQKEPYLLNSKQNIRGL